MKEPQEPDCPTPNDKFWAEVWAIDPHITWDSSGDVVQVVRFAIDSVVREHERAAYERGLEDAAQVALHLNGWGTPRNPELAEHIAKCIRKLK